MANLGYHVCDGCDECRTRTIAADPEASDWPCCEHFPDNKAPCRYAVIARCTSAVNIGGEAVDCVFGGSAGWRLLLWAVTELRKACYVGCEWVMRPTCSGGSADYDAKLVDVTANALNPAFPPAALSGGVLTYHAADYRSVTTACIAPNNCFGDYDPDCVNTIPDRWSLEVSGTAAGDVTFTLVDADIQAWATANGKTMPVYTSVATWEPFGRNRMDITAGYNDFPMLPKSICVVALDAPGASENPCADQDSRCACNDFNIGDTVTLQLSLTGCDGIAGLQGAVAVRSCSPESLPYGITRPSGDSCCIFLADLSTGAGCTTGAGEWSGEVKLMIYCDPEAAEAERYKMKVYCYNLLTSCWVEQNVSVTLVVLLCWGSFYIEFNVSELDCCCGGETVCCCGDTLVPNVLTASVEIDGVPAGDVTITRTGTDWVGTGTVNGVEVEITLSCQEGPGGCFWGLTIDCGTDVLFVTLVDSDCDPFEINFFTENILAICFSGSVGVTVTP